MEAESKTPEIKINRFRGINLRAGKHALEAGQGDRVQGLYPKQNGLLARIPGKSLYRLLDGEIKQVHQTFDGSGNILVQVGSTIQAYTLDDLLNRTVDVDLVQNLVNTDNLARAIIVQTESNTANGGSAQGYQSGGNDVTSAADTFYGRRLTHMRVNETVSALTAVSAFTASTGGGAASSTAGTFALVVGTYEINIVAVYKTTTGANSAIVMGLYDNTNSLFAKYSGTPVAILATVRKNNTLNNENQIIKLRGFLTVSGGTTTYQLSHKFESTSVARDDTICGSPTSMTGANVNGAAATNTYCVIEITRYT